MTSCDDWGEKPARSDFKLVPPKTQKQKGTQKKREFSDTNQNMKVFRPISDTNQNMKVFRPSSLGTSSQPTYSGVETQSLATDGATTVSRIQQERKINVINLEDKEQDVVERIPKTQPFDQSDDKRDEEGVEENGEDAEEPEEG
jgi:hypothetical protein